VLVIGAGMTGLAVACLLREAGLDVLVIERGEIASGVTGYTTAKLTSLHGLSYARLVSRYGHETARVYGEANESGLAWVAGVVADRGISCDLRHQPNYTYAATGDDREDVEAEAQAAEGAGLPACFVEQVPLPYPTSGAVRFANQAAFQPVLFLAGMAESLANDGCRIHERTRAVRLRDGSPCRVDTDRGPITAEHVVVATHFPFPDRALFFVRMHAERSYCIAAPLEAPAPNGTFISAHAPTRSVRTHTAHGTEMLVLGGESHKVGGGGPTSDRYRRLDEFAHRHFPLGETRYRWSTQDNMPVDGLPLVGKLTPRSRATWTATGFRKWGLAMAPAAAMIIRDGILGRSNPWQEAFDSNRLSIATSAAELAKENADVAFHFFADRLTRRAGDTSADLAEGEGKIVSRQGRQIAVSRDENGTLQAVSARCTHLGCIINWNDGERTWDCPCHGSRFARDGTVLHGPAVNPLKRREPPK
jgi:glycine/D-amino acid oxidase-like deaminating enzyme/nitrite reductase/ring-hydroxylating ferredoxin subunit